jgi:hypothetical protein
MTFTPEQIVVGLGIFLALWYLGASIYNRRRGISVYRWLYDGLSDLGGEVSGRWIGSSGSGARLTIHKATPPIKELEIIYLLASRELLPLFLVDMVRGKRDRVILKATLVPNPASELMIVPARSSLANQMRADRKNSWELSDGPHGLVIGRLGRGAEVLEAASAPFIGKYGAHIIEMSFARKPPHLITILSLSGLFKAGENSSALYADLRAVASATRAKQGGST